MEAIAGDLHIHTSASDSTASPTAVVSLAKVYGLSAIAITDHDTLAGINEALEAGLYYGIEIIPGIELTCEQDGEEVHILGYGVDLSDSAFQDALSDLRKRRAERINLMLEAMARKRIRLSLSVDAFLKAGRSVGRPHIAKELVARGYAKGIRDAYARFIGEDAPFYRKGQRHSVSEAIELMHANGAMAVLAHPYKISQNLLNDLMADYEFDGIEVFYPFCDRRAMQMLLNTCLAKGLVVTGGSDFHGEAKEKSFMGKVGLSKEYLDMFKGRLCQRIGM